MRARKYLRDNRGRFARKGSVSYSASLRGGTVTYSKPIRVSKNYDVRLGGLLSVRRTTPTAIEQAPQKVLQSLAKKLPQNTSAAKIATDLADRKPVTIGNTTFQGPRKQKRRTIRGGTISESQQIIQAGGATAVGRAAVGQRRKAAANKRSPNRKPRYRTANAKSKKKAA